MIESRGLSPGRGVFGFLLCLAQVWVLSACGPELDPISRFDTLRMVGVQKSLPFAHPGETVELSLLWEDPREDTTVPIETFFAFWCLNPPGDLFSECLSSPPSDLVDAKIVIGSNQFSVDIPEDALRPSLKDPRLPDSGSAVVFYGVCAGKLSANLLEEEGLESLASGEEAKGADLMPRCLDEDGDDVSPDDFVVGYSTILIYEELRNNNPVITAFEVEGKEVRVDCFDEDCSGPFELPPLEGCEEGVACIESCDDDGEIGICPEIEITALVAASSAESDDVAKVAYGTEVEEAIWVSYFADRGELSPQLKLVNDAVLGFQEDYSTKLYAPSEKGPMRIWAAVRDNRGGIAWLRLPAYVK